MPQQKAGKRAKSAAISGEERVGSRRKRAAEPQAAQWQRQLLLPSEDQRSAPLRAASSSVRKPAKRASRSRRELPQGDVALEVATQAVVAPAKVELAASSESATTATDGDSAAALSVEMCSSDAPSACAADGAEFAIAADEASGDAAAADGGETDLADALWATDAERDALLSQPSAAPAANGGTASAPDDDRQPSASASPSSLSDAASTPLQAATQALAALEQRGGRAYDAISCDCARALLERAQSSSPRAAELLIARAGVHVQRLSDRFERARARLQARIVAAEQDLGELPDERAACARGELVSAGRWLRRRACLPVAVREREHAEQLDEYQSASNEWVAVSALARAVDVVPEQAGPYNPLRIASDLLERIRAVSPTYLNAQLSRLEQLASMLALPELPEPAAKPAPRKR
jgi:Protein of unknown function (DUF2894)